MDLNLLNYVNEDSKWNTVKRGRRSMTRRPRKPGAVSNSPLQSQKTKSKIGLRNGNILKLMKKDVCHLDDFSGIELLAAAACSSYILDDVDHAEDFLVLKEHTTQAVHMCNVDVKKAVMPTESNGSSVQDYMVPDTYDNGNEKGEKKVVPSKELRLHWDLNTTMIEWEEPCNDDLLVEPQIQENCSDDVYSGGSESRKMKLEGYESRCAEVVVGAEERNMLNGVSVNQLSVKNDAAISVIPINKICNGDSFGNTSGDLTCSQEVMVTKTNTSKTSDGESCATKSDVVDSLINPGKCEDLSSSTTSGLQEQTMVRGESDTFDDQLVQSEPKNIISMSDRQTVFEEVTQGECQSPKLCKDYCENKVTSEDPVSDCCGSNVTQDEQGQMSEGDAMDKVEVGYDSPFEDGELREPTGWEENEVEEKKIISCESDYTNKVEIGTIDIPSSGKIEATCDHVKTTEEQSLLLVKDAEADTYTQVSGCQQDLVDSSCGSGRYFSDRKDGHSESRSNGGNLLRIDDSTSFGESYSQSGRDLGPEKSVGRDKVSFQASYRNDMRGSHVDSSIRVWDLKSSHNYHMPKNTSGDPIGRSVGGRNHDTRGYRRPSPSERTNSYGIQRGPLGRSLVGDGYRGGSGFHPRRAPEEDCHDPKPGYLVRRADYVNRPRRRSRSRSRSGSPIAWNFQKRRNLDVEARLKGKSGEMESLSRVEQHSPKCFDGQFRDMRQSPWQKKRCEPLKSDDHFQRPARFSHPTGREHKYKDNGEAIRRHERVIVNHSDVFGVRLHTMDQPFETRSRRHLDPGYYRDAR